MPRRHAVLALVVAVCWAVNFVVIDIGLESFPPLLFAALRFGLTAVPAIFFVRRPDMRWRAVVAVGLFIGVGQFGVLFVAMNTGLPAGLASVIAPLQPVFTIPLAVVTLGERPSLRQVAGVSLALAGLGTIAAGRAHGVPLQAVALGVASAVVVVSTFFGYGTWYWLLSRHAASTVAPFTLLVPVVGIFTAWLVRGEHPTWGELVGSLIVLVGLALALGLADALAVQRRAAAHAVPPSSCQFASNPSLLARCVREDRSGRAKRGRRRR
jgi:O-acetylserine/cysteine efflux transporter